eukprot:PhF_6_TR10981/c0_g1_i2/m.17746
MFILFCLISFAFTSTHGQTPTTKSPTPGTPPTVAPTTPAPTTTVPPIGLCPDLQKSCSGHAISGRAKQNPNGGNPTCTCQCRNYWNGSKCESCPSEYGGTDCDRCPVGMVRALTVCRVCTLKEDCNGDRATYVNASEDSALCVCTCRAMWYGRRCDKCDAKYNQQTCDRCATGYMNYPSCYQAPQKSLVDDEKTCISTCTQAGGSVQSVDTIVGDVRMCSCTSCRKKRLCGTPAGGAQQECLYPITGQCMNVAGAMQCVIRVAGNNVYAPCAACT